MMLLPLLLAALQAPAVLDEAVLVVRRDSVEVAREQYQLVASSRTGGWTLGATCRFAGPDVHGTTLVPVLAVGADSLPRTLQFDVTGPGEPLRVLGQSGRDRITLRYLGHGTERARELPVRGTTVVLDDSVASFYILAAWFARSSSVRLTAVFARSARTAAITVTDRGIEPTTVNRAPLSLRHVIVTGADGATLAHVWLDASGRLMKVENSGAHWTAERLAG